MTIPPISFVERFEARFPRAYRILITLAPLMIAVTIIDTLGHPFEPRGYNGAEAKERYAIAWDLLFGVWAVAPVWLAFRHMRGWWKALFPALLILAVGTMGLLGDYPEFYPTDVGGVAVFALVSTMFAIYAIAAFPLTALIAYLFRCFLPSSFAQTSSLP